MCRPLLRPRLCRSVLRSWLRLFSLCRCRRSRSTLLHARRRLLRRAQLLRMASRPLVPPPPRRLGPWPLCFGYEIIGQGSILSGSERNCPLRSQDFTTKHTEVTKNGKQMSLLCVLCDLRGELEQDRNALCPAIGNRIPSSLVTCHSSLDSATLRRATGSIGNKEGYRSCGRN